jgi:aconitate hydratase
MGSSRDWAAKGAFLLGIKAVITSSFERIHRSNLVMMGVLPLVYTGGQTAESLGLDGTESYDIELTDELHPRQTVRVTATHPGGKVTEFDTSARVDTPIEVEYLRNGGILHYVLRSMART